MEAILVEHDQCYGGCTPMVSNRAMATLWTTWYGMAAVYTRRFDYQWFGIGRHYDRSKNGNGRMEVTFTGEEKTKNKDKHNEHYSNMLPYS